MEKLGEKLKHRVCRPLMLLFIAWATSLLYDLETGSGFILQENTSRQATFAPSFRALIIVERRGATQCCTTWGFWSRSLVKQLDSKLNFSICKARESTHAALTVSHRPSMTKIGIRGFSVLPGQSCCTLCSSATQNRSGVSAVLQQLQGKWGLGYD